MLKNIVRKRHGFTLVEIIIAMAIAMLVLTAATSILISSTRFFRRGNQQYDKQSDIRLAADYISQHVRYAANLEVTNDPADGAGANLVDRQRIYINASGKLVHDKYNGSGYDIVYTSPFSLLGTQFTLNNNVLEYTVIDSNRSGYSLSADVLLPNLIKSASSTPLTGSIVKYATSLASFGLVDGVGGGGSGSITIYPQPIYGVVAPAANKRPVATIADPVQFTGTVTWLPNDFKGNGEFKNNVVYTATITLTPKEGFTLNGVIANQFTVSGGTASNAANSGVITVVFPKF